MLLVYNLFICLTWSVAIVHWSLLAPSNMTVQADVYKLLQHFSLISF